MNEMRPCNRDVSCVEIQEVINFDLSCEDTLRRVEICSCHPTFPQVRAAMVALLISDDSNSMCVGELELLRREGVFRTPSRSAPPYDAVSHH